MAEVVLIKRAVEARLWSDTGIDTGSAEPPPDEGGAEGAQKDAE